MKTEKRLIDANALIDILEAWEENAVFGTENDGTDGTTTILYPVPTTTREMRDLIAMQPTVDAEPVRRGHWIPKYIPAEGLGNSTHKLVYVCDRCGRQESRVEPYCHCGAKMEGDE